VFNRSLSPFTRFFKSSHLSWYLAILIVIPSYIYFMFLTILSIHCWWGLSLGYYLFIFLVENIRNNASISSQTWPAHSSFTLRYFPIFGLLYSFLYSRFFFFHIFYLDFLWAHISSTKLFYWILVVFFIPLRRGPSFACIAYVFYSWL
jgi:hypothetical protein